eukprot:Tbor_TRINITY_DN5666_c1_g1::TRINITY_DN5666_c1_g1_i1::g.8528::m.8528
MVRHIGQDWRSSQMHYPLEKSLMLEKYIRDAFLDRTCRSIMLHHGPISRSIPMSTQSLLSRKVATYHYNLHGIARHSFHIFPSVDRYNGKITAIPGTRNWVPYQNVGAWTFTRQVTRGTVLVHRVYWRGKGTDVSMVKGGWEHRWNKTLERNALQYNRV